MGQRKSQDNSCYHFIIHTLWKNSKKPDLILSSPLLARLQASMLFTHDCGFKLSILHFGARGLQ